MMNKKPDSLVLLEKKLHERLPSCTFTISEPRFSSGTWITEIEVSKQRFFVLSNNKDLFGAGKHQENPGFTSFGAIEKQDFVSKVPDEIISYIQKKI